ncbi:2-hydroxyhexa-2,4-dienoate hydratase [Roseovarius albus]|uniref:2-hydroxyhexa-2,4-dienoate hydratase n=1 Tax=Roseovarius albus TaxID=1247867 RepID=A0A1X6ZUY9_9RHOB|nr:2-oxo-hepta-3-ene-1,7-dioic acid hydratase [Roseovarius albus]SLN62087.1 2-hydroxyhexa-2,4-dienoate hydratase [Roseovarius albus]
MALNDKQINALAGAYDEAEATRILTRAPSCLYPDFTMADAYKVQSAWVDLRLAKGEKVIGHKIGLTSRAMQLAVGIDTPDYGVLTDAMVIGDGAVIAPDRFIMPRFEVELGFKLKAPLSGPNVTISEVLNATDWVIPAIEVIDCRSHLVDPETDKPLNVKDSIADNAANGGIIWGGSPQRPGDVDLRMVPGILYRNGKIEETGVSAGVLGHPANGLVWLTRELHKMGAFLAAGEFVLGGSFTRPVAGAPGDTIQCDFGGMGQVSCSIGGDA